MNIDVDDGLCEGRWRADNDADLLWLKEVDEVDGGWSQGVYSMARRGQQVYEFELSFLGDRVLL